MFVVAGAAFSLVALAALLLEEAGKPEPNDIPAPNQEQANNTTKPRWVLPEASILFLLASNFLTVGSLFMVMTFGTVYMNLIGGTASQVGALFGLSALGEVPGMLFGRRLARRIGDTNVLLFSLALIAFGYIGLAFSSAPWMMLVFGPVRGLGFGIFLVGTVTIINQRAPENMYATYQGLLNSLCWGLAPLLSGPLGGLIYESMGPAKLFFINASLIVLAGALLLPTYRLWHKQPQIAAVTVTQPEEIRVVAYGDTTENAA
jgi:MFS family permease